MHLEHLFQEIHFQHFVIYTKRDEFLKRHIAKGHCGTDPRETNNVSKSGYRQGKRRHPGTEAATPTLETDASFNLLVLAKMASRQVNCFAKGSFLSWVGREQTRKATTLARTRTCAHTRTRARARSVCTHSSHISPQARGLQMAVRLPVSKLTGLSRADVKPALHPSSGPCTPDPRPIPPWGHYDGLQGAGGGEQRPRQT